MLRSENCARNTSRCACSLLSHRISSVDTGTVCHERASYADVALLTSPYKTCHSVLRVRVLCGKWYMLSESSRASRDVV
jgi:hypothetical protein